MRIPPDSSSGRRDQLHGNHSSDMVRGGSGRNLRGARERVPGEIFPAPNPFNPNPANNTTSAKSPASASLLQQLSEAILQLFQRLGIVSVPESAEPTGASQPREWSPWDGPRDRRDAMPIGGGRVTSSGAPEIRPNSEPASNQYNYTGPAARNPYFSTPSNPLREGYVRGFQNWFENPMMLGGLSGPMPANKQFYATEEGAQEALRLVRQFAPDATIEKNVFVSGPFSIDTPMYNITLPGGRQISAGSILTSYYNNGQGVTTASDDFLKRTIQLA